MGQAKLRGSKADRVAEGIRKQRERDEQREIDRAARWRAMTPKQREMALLIASMEVQFGMRFTP